jgi:hypothetical protein
MIILETERLLFRPHEPGDREAYCAMEQDAEVRRYIGGAPRTREAAEAKFLATLHPTPGLLRLWATVLKATGIYIGRCGVYPHIENDTAVPGEGVLAFYFARPYWGHCADREPRLDTHFRKAEVRPHLAGRRAAHFPPLRPPQAREVIVTKRSPVIHYNLIHA